MKSKLVKKSKKILLLIIFLLALTSVLTIKSENVYAYSGSGTGTTNDPYVINSRAELLEISNNLTANYRLDCDIDLGSSEWTPLGTSSAKFSGVLDGKGHTIKNLYVNKLDLGQNGLFAYLNSAIIKNLNLRSVNIIGGNDTGALAANVIGTSIIDNCSADGKIIADGTTGGLVGTASGLNISNSYSSVSITGKGNYVGGLIGALTGNITSSYAIADVVSKSGIYTGGLVGAITGNITQCYTTNNIISAGDSTGGISGWINGNVQQSYATGSVTSSGNGDGGIIGSLYAGTIQNSFNLASVSGVSGVGGIQGNGVGSIQYCYSSGKITGLGAIGGLTGVNVPIISSYYDGNASGYIPQNAYDTSRSTTSMKMQNTFVDWEFLNTWAIDDGKSYPYLKNVKKPSGVSQGLPSGEMTSGSGTKTDPYIISTAQQLQNINYNLCAYYKLQNDIDLRGIKWTPIGNNNVPFTGTLDGNGHAIKNLSMNRLGLDLNGLFGSISSATIRNLNLNNVNIIGGKHIGAIAGNVTGTSIIDNCSADGVINTSINGVAESYIGGLVGQANTLNISNSNSSISITGSGNRIGGLVGEITGNVTNSYATGNVTSKSGDYTGGIAGVLGGNITGSYSTNTISSKGNTVGGVTGWFKGTMDQCYSAGSVTTVANNAGGLSGYVDSGTIQNSFNLAPVIGAAYVGGIQGTGAASVVSCYSVGKISGSSYLGGLTGINTSITNSYYDGITSGYVPQNAYDVSRITSAMKHQSNFVNWEFINAWTIDEGSSYPYLKNVKKPNGLNNGEVLNGNGTPDNPYIISTAQQLQNIKYQLGASYRLGNDIDLSGVKWTALGNNTSFQFTGTLDGAGYLIKNLSMNRLGTDFTGLFNYINGATIKNLKLDSVNLIGGNYTGALAAYSTGSTIDNCSVSGTINGYVYTGGLIGQGVSGTNITNSSSSAKVNGSNQGSSSGNRLGGLVGDLNGSITNSNVTGDVVSTSGNYVGGFVGVLTGSITKSYVSNNVTSQESYVGGGVGWLYGNINQSYTVGSVTGLDDVGGLVGYSYMAPNVNPPNLISDSYNLKFIQGRSNVGGIQGYDQGITDWVGTGYRGNNYYTWYGKATIKNCYSAGKVMAQGASGGISGTDTIINSCYYDAVSSQYSPQDSLDVARLTTAMKQQSNFTGWDFINTWAIDELTSYPYLKSVQKPAGVTEGLPTEEVAGGKGTADDPYMVSTAEQLENMTNDLRGYYKLAKDIDLNGVNWTPIGINNIVPFTGVFDGNGYSIKNLSMNKLGDSNPVGLFSYLNGATIKNLKMDNVNILGGNNTGALAGSVAGVSTIDNCSVTGTITAYGNTGGLVGAGNKLNISNSNSSVTINIVNGDGINGDNVGDLVGNLTGNITNSYAVGDVVSKTGNNTGGLVGAISGNITKCYTTNNVNANGNNTGGIVGNANTGTVDQSYATGSVTTTGSYVGGIAGITTSMTIQNNFNMAVVTGVSNVGGIQGSGNLTMKYCYSTGKVIGTGANIGGLTGNTTSVTVNSSYYDAISSGYIPQTSLDVSRITSSMKQKTNFLNWEFINTWGIDEGKSYPYLKNMPKPDEVSNGLPTGEVKGGKGTVEDPYIITTVQQLENIQCDLGANYKLGNNIDLKGINWTPIGTNSNVQFTGTFDGNGYTIENLTTNRLGNDVTGLFGYVNGGDIKNVKLTGVNIIGRNYTGALAGNVTGTSIIDNCSSDGTIIAYGNTGGLVGLGNGLTISNSNSSVKITIVDGIGLKGEVVSGDNVGDLIGNLTGNVINSYATGDVISKAGNNTGGLVGYIVGNITKCYTTNNVNSNGNNVGGLAGCIQGTIDQSYATGSVTTIGSYAGGLAGVTNSTTNVIQNSFNTVSVCGSSYVGGIQGNGTTAIKYCYSAGKILSSGTYIGGITGNGGTLTSSYYDGMASGFAPQNANDISRLTAEMECQGNFKNWEFVNTWGIDEGKSYPYLKSITKPDSVTVVSKYNPIGKGTQDNPYIITNVDELVNIKYDLAAYYKLGRDIDLSGISWTPIGNSNAQFTGTFDGDGYSIKNLSMDNSGVNVNGLFGYIKGATIKNVVMKDTNILGGDYVGALVANVAGTSTIDGCLAIDGTVSGGSYVGGLVGCGAALNISNSSSTVTVIGKSDNIGGLVGNLAGNITNCYTIGDVTSDGNNVGGIAGNIAGGITGSYANGNVTSNTANNVGGLAGALQGPIVQSYSTGTISGVNNVGGLVGSSTSSTVQDSFNIGNVIGTNLIGGIQGTGNAKITNCYSAGKVTGTGANIGGITSSTASIITKCYFDSTASGIKAPADQAKATSDLQNKVTYSGWDFTFTWGMDKAYPYLRKLSIPLFPNSGDQTRSVDGFKVTKVTGTSIRVQWNPIRGVDGYDIEVDGKVIDNGTDISYTARNLTPGTSHTFRVRLRTKDGVGAWTDLITETTPNDLKGVSAVVTSTSIKLLWNAVDGATGYDVEMDGNIIDNENNMSYEIGGLTPGTTHNFRVRVKTPDGIGEWSDLGTKTTPGEVRNITSSITGTTVDISWAAVSGAIGYEVEVDGKIVENGTSTSYEAKNLISGTSHNFRVRAITADGIGDWSATVTRTTLDTIEIKDITALVAGNSIQLNWNAILGATGYDVEIDGKIIDNGNNTSYVAKNLQQGTLHTYRIRPKTSDTIGNFSNKVSKTTLAVLTSNNVNVVVSDGAIKLSWNAILGATGYDVEVDGTIINNGNSTVYTGEKLENGSTHTYRIRAKSLDTIGQFSDPITKTILCKISSSDVTSVVSSGAINLSWNAIAGATGYDVEINGKVIDSESGTSYQLLNITAGTSYKFRIRAKSASGAADWSELITKTALDVISSDSIKAVATGTSVNLSWNAVLGAAGYDIDVDGTVIDNGNSTTYDAVGLETGVTHVYRVRAKNADTIGQWSNVVTKTTLDTIKNVSAIVTDTSVKLSWEAISGATDYDVEVDGTVIDNGNGAEYKADNLKAGSIHTYRIRPKTDKGLGDFGNVITKVILSTISKDDIKVDVTDTAIKINWAPVNGATGYDIEVNGSVIDNGNNTNYNIENLVPGSVYKFRIRAKAGSGVGEFSDLITKTVLSTISVNDVTASATDTSVKLSWNAVDGATGYDVEVDGTVIDNVNSTVYEADGLQTGVTHIYRIRPKTEDTVGNFSDKITETTLAVISPSDITTSITDTSIKLNWNAINAATGYDIEVDGNVVDNGNNTEYELTGLTIGETHIFRIRAKIASGVGDWSTSINRTNLAIIATDNVVAVATGTSVKLSWGAVTGAIGYDVEVDGKVIDNGSSTVYIATGLDVGVTHTYRIRPKTADTIGNFSNPIIKTTLSGIDSSTVASQVTGTSIKLEWGEVDGATGYDVEVDGKIIDNGKSTVYEADGLVAGITHTYRIRPKTTSGIGDFCEPILKTTLDTLKEKDVASVVTDTSVKLSWNAIEGATGYDIEVDGVVIDNGNSTVYEANSLQTGVTHHYRIRGKTAAGVGEWSETVTKTTLAVVAASNISATATGTTINLSWGAVNGAAGYDVEVDGVIVDAGANTSYKVTGLTPGINHEFRIRAKTGQGTGEWSVPINKATISVISVNDVTVDITSSSIKLSWAAVDGALGYDVEVDGNIVDNSSSTSYEITNLEEGITHTFRIRAKIADGVGDWSMPISRTILSKIAVNDIKVSSTDSSINLSWVTVKGATGYDVEVDGKLVDNGNGTSYKLDSLTIGTNHTFRVRAKTADTIGEWSDIVSRTTLGEISADNITAVVTDTTIKYTWDAVNGISGYDVEVDGKLIDNGNNTSYEAEGLTAGTTHTFRVREKGNDASGDWSDMTHKTTLGVISSDSVISSVTDTTIRLTWDAVIGATGYDVEFDGNVIDNGNSTSYEVNGLVAGTTHKVRLRAKTLDTIGQWSNEIDEVTLAVVTPNNINTSVSDSSIKYKWNEVAGAVGYDVEIDGKTINNGNITSYEADSLQPGTKHTFRVRAKAGSTLGQWSDTITKTTLAVITDVIKTSTHTSIQLDWKAVVGATGYDVEVDGKAIDNGTNTSYKVDGLDIGSSHTFRVRAKSEDTIGEWSIVINESTKSIDKVKNTTVQAAYNSIKLTWDAVDEATGYDVEVNGKVIDNENSTTYVAQGLDPNIEYSFRVRAKISSAVGDWSDAITGKPVPSPNLGIEADNYNLMAGNTFTIVVDMKNVVNINSEDIIVKYDSNLFTYGSAEPVDPNSNQIYYADDSTEGAVRIIGGTTGDNTLNSDSKLFKLTFKAKIAVGNGLISVSQGNIGDKDSQNYIATCSGQNFNIINCDVNGDGKIDMLDVNIVSRLIGTTQDKWGSYKPDVNGDGKVDQLDRQYVAKAMLASKSK
ncbi:fibronectin type III domain-containing protein [Clostridium sp. SHJSY1]|uniref:fibronectin type III domain-containing protein n=1 Tax=Clostridium sp. SHJSY1 TaxID=2942483 RepID=UPI00287559A1|nr:fibronectin type III domain-containing protein [Clostridium sp. SHJSY1]MDS0526067.1 fibronectin type III domain-containing protein [Clostridium sp. SHJSY1]